MVTAAKKRASAEIAKQMAKAALARWPDQEVASDDCLGRIRSTFGVSEDFATHILKAEASKRGIRNAYT